MKKNKPQGTIVIDVTPSLKLYLEPKKLAVVGMWLSLTYAIAYPILDLNYRIVVLFGRYFLDSSRNTTTFESNIYYIAYIPLILLSFIWAYGVYWQNRKGSGVDIIKPIFIVLGTLVLYFAFSFYFGFRYHFVF